MNNLVLANKKKWVENRVKIKNLISGELIKKACLEKRN